MTSTTTWTYNLAEEKDPVKQACIIGLHRVLSKSAASKVHTTLVQTKTCTWELTDSTVTITFTDLADLNAITRKMLGDFTRGIAIIPGYPTNPLDESFKISINVHRASIHNIFKPAKKGPQWAASTNPGARKDKKPYLDKFVADNAANFELLKGFGNITPNAALPSADHPDRLIFPPSLELKSLKPQPILAMRHPMFTMWYNNSPSILAQEAFLLSFAIAGYVYLSVNTVTASENKKAERKTEYVAIGLVADAFSQVDAWMDKWLSKPQPEINGPPELALWTLATILNLPDANYPVIDRVNNNYYLFRPTQCRLYPLMKHIIEASTFNEEVEDEIFDEDFIKISYDPLLWPILNNYLKGFPWSSSIPKNINCPYPYVSRSRILKKLVDTLGSPMEKQVVKRFIHIIRNVKGYLKGETTKTWEQIDTWIIVVLRKDIHEALHTLQRWSSDAKFTAEEYNWILDQCAQGYEERTLNILRVASQIKYEKPPEPEQPPAIAANTL